MWAQIEAAIAGRSAYLATWAEPHVEEVPQREKSKPEAVVIGTRGDFTKRMGRARSMDLVPFPEKNGPAFGAVHHPRRVGARRKTRRVQRLGVKKRRSG
jgi:hypothetical protein